uniref:Tetraspanin n=1 Tax=Fredericella sultana TaxID=349672 RepID=I4E997_9BILA|nr:tetraspanin [Fredericella sultana]
MAACATLSRYLVVAVNVLFFIIGSASVGVGLMVVLDKSRLINSLSQMSLASYAHSVPSLLTNAAYVFLGSGAVIILLSFCGCVGAVKKITPLLIAYGIVVLVLAIFEIGIIAAVSVFSQQLEGTLKEAVKKSLDDHYVGGPLNATLDGAFLLPASNDITHGWDIMQAELGCCGVDGGADYNTTKQWTQKIMYNASGFAIPIRIPATCCQLKSSLDAASIEQRGKSAGRITLVDSSCPATLSSSHYDTGCYSPMKDLVNANGIAILAVSSAVAAVQVFLAVITFVVVHSIRLEMKQPAAIQQT